MGGIVKGVGNAVSGLFGGGRKDANAIADANRLSGESFDKAIKLQEPFRQGALTGLPALQKQALGNPLQSEDYKIQQAALNAATNANNAAGGNFRSGAGMGALSTGNLGLIRNAFARKDNALSNLLNIGTGANANITGLTTQQGQDAAQSIIAQQNAINSGNSQTLNTLLQAAGTAAMFSDPLLKDDIRKTGETQKEGINHYSWKWSKEAEKLGLSGRDSGYMAHEVEKVYPDLVHKDASGYNKVNVEELEKRIYG